MTRTGYVALKNHFDTIFIKKHGIGNGYEQIRDVYTYAFGTKIHLYDVYHTNLRVANNAIDKITTLIGPENDDLKHGIIPCLDTLQCVNILKKEYMMGLTENNVDDYIMDVYNAMCNIMIADPLYNVSDNIARSNPYCAFLKICPFYFTYHHIAYVDADLINRNNAFEHILEKYICDVDDASKILESLAHNKYSTDFEEIYSTMTCNRTVDILL